MNWTLLAFVACCFVDGALTAMIIRQLKNAQYYRRIA
jgi:hypothetical protein